METWTGGAQRLCGGGRCSTRDTDWSLHFAVFAQARLCAGSDSVPA